MALAVALVLLGRVVVLVLIRPEPLAGGTVELALGEAALTGLLSWLEAAPPGSHLDVAL